MNPDERVIAGRINDHDRRVADLERAAQHRTGPLVQAGSTVATTNASGDVSITFPITFPVACTTVVASNGDPGVGPDLLMNVIAVPSTSAFNLKVWDMSANVAFASTAVRINWVAVGT